MTERTLPSHPPEVDALYRSLDDSIEERCATISAVLRGCSWDDVQRMRNRLDARTQSYLLPEPDALVQEFSIRIYRGRRRAVFLEALNDIVSLPPDIGAPALHALACLGRAENRERQYDAAMALMGILRTRGHIFVDLISSIGGSARKLIFPLPSHQRLAAELLNLARLDPHIGSHLAHALKANRLDDVAACLCDLSPSSAAAVVQSAPDDIRSALLDAVASRIPAIVIESCDLAMVRLWRLLAKRDPLCAFGIAALGSADPAVRFRGFETIASAPSVSRAVMPMLRADLRSEGANNKCLSFVIADLFDTSDDSPHTRGLRRV